MANSNPQLPAHDQPHPKIGNCFKCGKFKISLWWGDSRGYCDKCAKQLYEIDEQQRERQHQLEMIAQRIQHEREGREEKARRRQQTQEEEERRRTFKSEQAERQRQHERQESEMRRQQAAQERAHQLECEKIKRDQEQSKQKQEEAKATALSYQKEIERFKLQQQQEQTQVRKLELAFQLQRANLDLANVLVGCDSERITLIKQILQLTCNIQEKKKDTKKQVRGTTPYIRNRNLRGEEEICSEEDDLSA